MTYHASRIPLGGQPGTLAEITAADMKTHGPVGEARFAPATWDAVHVDGKQYAVPFDTHPIVLYYNKDKLAAAGLIGDDGLPKDLNGIDNFNAALKKLQDGGTKWGDLHGHRRRQLRVPHHLLAALPAGRRASARTARG